MTIKEVQITVYGQYVFCFATLRPNKKGSKGWKWALSIKTFFSLMYLLLELALTAGFLVLLSYCLKLTLNRRSEMINVIRILLLSFLFNCSYFEFIPALGRPTEFVLNWL